MTNLEPIEGMLDDMLLDLYIFRMKYYVWGNYTELWRKWIRTV